MTQNSETPLFTRSFDFLDWLLPMTNHFPRAHRHTFTHRLLSAAFDLRERLELANARRGAARLEQLRLADESLAHIRTDLRLAVRWKWLTPGQYRHAAGMVAEIGRLLGKWIQNTESPDAAPAGRARAARKPRAPSGKLTDPDVS